MDKKSLKKFENFPKKKIVSAKSAWLITHPIESVLKLQLQSWRPSARSRTRFVRRLRKRAEGNTVVSLVTFLTGQ